MFEKLKTTKCPICGSKEITKEGRRNKHTNGTWNEFREFGCGYEVLFSPNFMREVLEGKCSKDPSLFTDKRNRVLKNILSELEFTSVDQAFKDDIKKALSKLKVEKK